MLSARHGDVSLTLNVYSHVLPDMGDAAARAMDAALGESSAAATETPS